MTTNRAAGPVAIVHRGEAGVFRLVREHFATPELSEVLWDRRLGERRSSRQDATRERRRQERRNPPPDTWQAFGFLILAKGSAKSR